MRYLSVCSGIEAASVAWQPLGFEPVAFAEIDRFPCAVLEHHYPTVPNWGDMTQFKDWPDADIDLLVGGTPCQSFSVAGLRAGLADPRGNLALTYLAVLDRYRPRWMVWENVPGVLSSVAHDAPDPREPPPPLDLGCDGAEVDTADEYDADESHAFSCFLAGLSELGYGWSYASLDAQYAGLAQRRLRVFVVGHIGDWRRAAAVLFERESLQGHPAPSREAGEDVTGTLTGGATSGGHGRFASADAAAQNLLVASERARALTASSQRYDYETETLIPIDLRQASRGEKITNNRATGSGGAPGHGVGDSGDPAFTVSALGQAVAFDARQSDTIQYGDKSGPLDTDGHTVAVRLGMQVRRLTPEECEALQGFPRGYTAIPYRGKQAADGNRYKALGNSMAVPVVRWIGERITLVDESVPSHD